MSLIYNPGTQGRGEDCYLNRSELIHPSNYVTLQTGLGWGTWGWGTWGVGGMVGAFEPDIFYVAPLLGIFGWLTDLHY